MRNLYEYKHAIFLPLLGENIQCLNFKLKFKQSHRKAVLIWHVHNCIDSNIKSKYQSSHHIAVRLTDLLSKTQRSVNLTDIGWEWCMLRFFVKTGYNHQEYMLLCPHRARQGDWGSGPACVEFILLIIV